MSKWQWILQQFTTRLWVRASLFCVLAVATALFAILIEDYIPDELTRKIGVDAVDNILQIIANSMLAVTTFSLSTMVAAYSAATSNVTPRATQLLLRDRTTQNALSVFIGAFLYSLVGIIALSMEVYGDSGRVVLFAVTILVIALIVGVLLQWIDYLSRLGRVGETINMVEDATADALKNRMKSPYLGGVELRDYKPKRTHHPVHHDHIGYIQHIDIGALSGIAAHADAEFYLDVTPGSFNESVTPILYSSAKLEDELLADIRSAFSIGDTRSFEQDPRFGMIVLSEIASRALSPALNDPGTAIHIIGSSVRLLAPWAEHTADLDEPLYPNIHVPTLRTADLFDDLFAGTARDGASMVQVGMRLQKALAALANMGHEDMRNEALRHSKLALDYANNALPLKQEKATLAALAKKI